MIPTCIGRSRDLQGTCNQTESQNTQRRCRQHRIGCTTDTKALREGIECDEVLKAQGFDATAGRKAISKEAVIIDIDGIYAGDNAHKNSQTMHLKRVNGLGRANTV